MTICGGFLSHSVPVSLPIMRVCCLFIGLWMEYLYSCKLEH
jgi:hypothetical protein